MDDKREHGGYVVSVACTVFLVLIAVYFGGYFGLSVIDEIPVPSQDFPHRYVRLYPFRWIAVAYRPLARMESAVTGEGYCTAIESKE